MSAPSVPEGLRFILTHGVDAARRADSDERAIIESSVLHGLDGIRSDLPQDHNDGGDPLWFVAPGGFACLLIDEDAGTGLLCRCWVLPEHRGRGVADRLYHIREAAARDLGIARLRVVLAGNARRAQMAYFARGFTKVRDLARGRVLLARRTVVA